MGGKANASNQPIVSAQDARIAQRNHDIKLVRTHDQCDFYTVGQHHQIKTAIHQMAQPIPQPPVQARRGLFSRS